MQMHQEITTIADQLANTSRSGFIYVLVDGPAGLCKIGRTISERKRRQSSITAGHGSILMNILTVKVQDRFAAESQCHNHFSQFRTNGEWFNISPMEAIKYIHKEVDWMELDFENPARTIQYLLASRTKDYSRMREALKK